MNRLYVVFVGLIAISIGGCGSIPQQPYDKQANSSVKKIALLAVPEIKQYQISTKHLGNAFGIIGAMIAEQDLNEKITSFNSSMESNNLMLWQVLTNTLYYELSNKGYDVVLIDSIEREPTKFIENYKDIDEDVDAYIDTYIWWAGYKSDSIASPFIPTIHSWVRVIASKNEELLYTTEVSYGHKIYNEAKFIPVANRSLEFDSFDELITQADNAADGLSDAVKAIAQQIAAEL
ncbi:MAG: hypothetical protein M3H12_02755 [Chromatiales bacterium]|nr:hypothetical protein [Gammaproteobacteria bacterium]